MNKAGRLGLRLLAGVLLLSALALVFLVLQLLQGDTRAGRSLEPTWLNPLGFWGERVYVVGVVVVAALVIRSRGRRRERPR